MATIYAFARSADDFADEGDLLPQQRLDALSGYEHELDLIAAGAPSQSALFIALGSVINEYALPLQPFRDLLSAFKQDVVTTRYASFEALLDYCRRSANPVGVLMLHLYGAASPDNIRQSDAICSALQLINFWQDVAIDWDKQRIYLPLEDLQRFNVTEQQLAGGAVTPSWHDLMQFQIERARAMMLSGAPLALRLPGRIGWELRMVIQGGLRILERIENNGHDMFRRRPKLGKPDWLRIVWRGMTMAKT